MHCPTDEMVDRFVCGQLSTDEIASIEEHLSKCDPCLAVVGELARTTDDTDDSLAAILALDPAVAPQGALSRFRVSALLGRGAMGLVFSAYDPELDRQVAVKVLRTSRDSSRGRLQLVREARAMAKVEHPNVITVHEAGTMGDRAYVVMEHVDGGTLRHWLDAKRTWKQIVRAFVAAGQGLAAAHAAGLVHRDFKPSNVLVGSNGRIRVGDFGLAGTAANDIAAPGPGFGAAAATTQTLTWNGTLVGTPAYMAPEQSVGGQVGAQADQFSFCVALYEALFDERPFEGETVTELRENIVAGRIRSSPNARRVPLRIRRALRRGLQPDPHARWPSLTALLTELTRVLSARRRRLAMAAVAIGVCALVIAILMVAECSSMSAVCADEVCEANRSKNGS